MRRGAQFLEDELMVFQFTELQDLQEGLGCPVDQVEQGLVARPVKIVEVKEVKEVLKEVKEVKPIKEKVKEVKDEPKGRNK